MRLSTVTSPDPMTALAIGKKAARPPSTKTSMPTSSIALRRLRVSLTAGVISTGRSLRWSVIR